MKLSDFIGESTEYDKKEMLEERRPKSWLKSVSAFANGIGGTLVFGISDDEVLIGLDDSRIASEKISEAIKTKMDPIPQVALDIHAENEKEFVVLRVHAGQETPYYYIGDGNRIAYVRVGNESVPANAVDLKRLVLRGSNTSFDSLSTRYSFEAFAFTKLRTVYRMKTGIELADSDFASFELVDENNMLTNAGVLLADESQMRHSRLFCTRWYGLDKASGVMDALDDKEYSGSLVSLLQNGMEFVKNNTKKRWRKTGNGRIEMPEYPEQAVHEVIVNALIHRDYMEIGSEVHIDIFSRMHFMERRGSGFKKIKEDYRHAVNYRPEIEPEFRSTPTSFFVTLYNLNFNVPIEKMLIDSENVAVGDEKVLIDSENLLIEIAIHSLHANKNTKDNARKLFARMGFEGVFGRNDIMETIDVSITAAGNFINKLKEAELIESVSGQGKGKYRFIEPKT